MVFGSILLDNADRIPLLVSGLTGATVLLIYFWPHRQYAWHYLGMARLIISASLLPLFGVNSTDERALLGLVMLGLLLLIGGLLDHRLLARTLATKGVRRPLKILRVQVG